MKMKCWPLVLLIAMMAWACSDDDVKKAPDPEPETPEAPGTPETPETPEVEEDPKEFVFTIQGNVLSAETSLWVLVSDRQGNVFGTGEVKNNTSVTFNAPENFAEETVTLTLISNFDGSFKSVSVSTFTHIPFGTYGWEIPDDNGSGGTSTPAEHMAGLTLKDYDNWTSYTSITGPNVNYGRAESEDTDTKFSISMRTETAKVLIAKTNSPFKYFYTELTEGDNQIVPSSAFLPAETHDIQVPEAEFVSYNIAGINGEGQFSYYNQNDNDPTSHRAIPVIPDFFTSYAVSLTAQKGNVWNYYDFRGTTLPDALKQIEGTVTSNVGTNNNVSWQTTGVFDAVSVRVTGIGENLQFADWIVHGSPGNNQSVVVPEIPATVPLVSTNMERSISALSAKYSFKSLLTEYPDYTGYFDVVVRPTIVLGASLPWTEILRKEYR
jgi:hypothetical protein